jgi:outer membrane receptor protein involved in Fe transport
MGYFTWSRGIKSGGYDARSNNAPATGGSFEFDDEEAESIEVGAKFVLADGAADLNVALYYTDYDQLQVSAFDGVLGFNVGNAARAVTSGAEIDARWLVTDKLLLTGSVAFTDFEFKKFFGECYFGQVPDAPDGINCDYAGKTNQFVADYSGAISADYSVPIGASLNFAAALDWVFVGDHLLSSNLDPLQQQDAYSKFNGRIAIGDFDRRWELALIGKNLTDKSIKTLSGDVPLAGSNFGTPGFSAYFEQPRTIALQFSLRYE